MTGISREAMERAVAEPIKAAISRLAASRNSCFKQLERPVCPDCARAVGDAVIAELPQLLAAWLAGEPSGPYSVGHYPHPFSPEGREWAVEGPWAPSDTTLTQSEARAIANALNALALAAPTGDTR